MDSQTKNGPSRTVLYVIIIIVVVLVLWWLFSIDGDMVRDEEPVEIAPGQTLQRANQGSLVEGFPEELILEEGVIANDSYSINYADSNVNQPVVSFVSSMTMEENVEAYRTYFQENDWNITNEADAQEDVTYHYARKGNQDVNVTFENIEDAAVRVVIAVATRGGTNAESADASANQ